VIGDILVDDPPWNLVELEQHYSARHGGEFTAGRPGIRDNTAARRDRSQIVAASRSIGARPTSSTIEAPARARVVGQ
jgi:hypothetical protein